jgi:hypothetical protein
MDKEFKLSLAQQQALKEVIAGLVERYQPVWICCFGHRLSQHLVMNCFDGGISTSCSHYFLLMVTPGRLRLEHEAQDYLNSHFPELDLTLLVHGEETVVEQLQTGNWFFNRVLSLAEKCYSKDGRWLHAPLPETNELAASNTYFIYRLEMAKGFYKGAQAMAAADYTNVALFLLHQCTEQAFSAMIRVFLNYRSDIHNLGRLMKLCLCFTSMPLEVFPQHSDADKFLFSLLQRSYSETRYRDGFEVKRDDFLLLQLRVKTLLDRMELLCSEQLQHNVLSLKGGNGKSFCL